MSKRRARSDDKKKEGHHHHSTSKDDLIPFQHLPLVSIANFSSPQANSVTLTLTLLPREIARSSVLASVRAKLMFHPLAAFEHEKEAQQEQEENSNQPGALPVRIICKIIDLTHIEAVGGEPARDGRVKVRVGVAVESISVDSDGMCSAKIVGGNNHDADNSNDNGDDDADKDPTGIELSIRCRNARHFQNLHGGGNKKNKHKKGEDGEKQEEQADQEEEQEQLFTAVVPLDMPKLAKSPEATSASLSGKYVLLSVEDGGLSWRAHFGLTPTPRSQDRKKWHVVMPPARAAQTENGEQQQQQAQQQVGGDGDDEATAAMAAVAPAKKPHTSLRNWKGQGVDIKNPRATRHSTTERIVIAYELEASASSSSSKH